MPDYIYRCECETETIVTHRMSDAPRVVCPDCGAIMHKRPQGCHVNWGGLKPSQGELHPNIKRHIADAQRRREEV